jgi:hypothetical protein
MSTRKPRRALIAFTFTGLALSLLGCVEEPDLVEDAEGGEVVEAELEGAATDSQSQDLIVDGEGRAVGYLDKAIEPRDLAGNPLRPDAAQLADSDQRYRHRVMLFEHANFGGRDYSYFSGSRVLSFNLGGVGLDNVVTSVVAPPGCRVTLFENHGLTGQSLVFNQRQSKAPTYVGDLAQYGWSDRASSVRVECAAGDNSFAGYLYKGTNYLGDRLPIYTESRLSFADPRFQGWNDQVSSVAHNFYVARGEGIVLWEHSDAATNIYQHRLLLEQDDLSLHNGHGSSTRNFGDQVSGVETDRELQSGEMTSAVVGRVLTAAGTVRQWGHSFMCGSLKRVCPYSGALGALTAVYGRVICGVIVGTAVIEGITAAGSLALSGGTDAEIAVPIAGFSIWQLGKGVACMATASSAIVTVPAACDATMETFCADNVGGN